MNTIKKKNIKYNFSNMRLLLYIQRKQGFIIKIYKIIPFLTNVK